MTNSDTKYHVQILAVSSSTFLHCNVSGGITQNFNHSECNPPTFQINFLETPEASYGHTGNVRMATSCCNTPEAHQNTLSSFPLVLNQLTNPVHIIFQTFHIPPDDCLNSSSAGTPVGP